jgi:5-formyltetrahydrofolate cyclo-ligase
MERIGRGPSQHRPCFRPHRRRARVIKCNPDPPQIPVRLRALYDDKLLFSPVPYLSKGFPYLGIDPDKLAAKGVDFETAATAQGLMGQWGADRI